MPYRIDQRSRSVQVDVVTSHRSEDIAIKRHCQFGGAYAARRNEFVIKEHLGSVHKVGAFDGQRYRGTAFGHKSWRDGQDTGRTDPDLIRSCSSLVAAG